MEKTEHQFRKFLAANKLKFTPERRRIFQEIVSSEGHFDAEELFARLRSHDKRVSRATVYRTLDLLLRLGIVRRVCFGERTSLYESLLKQKRHGYLVCLACGGIDEFPLAEVAEHLKAVCENAGFDARNRCITISGFCDQCQSSSNGKRFHQIQT